MPNRDCAHVNAMQGSSGATICLDCGQSLDDPDVQAAEERSAAVEAIPVTTLPTIPGYSIVWQLGLVAAQEVHGVGIGRDFLAGMSNTFGGRSGTFERGLGDARERVLYEMRAQAYARGGNGLAGAAFDQHVIGSGGGSATMLLVTGTATAVVIEAAVPEDQR